MNNLKKICLSLCCSSVLIAGCKRAPKVESDQNNQSVQAEAAPVAQVELEKKDALDLWALPERESLVTRGGACGYGLADKISPDEIFIEKWSKDAKAWIKINGTTEELSIDPTDPASLTDGNREIKVFRSSETVVTIETEIKQMGEADTVAKEGTLEIKKNGLTKRVKIKGGCAA